jgi:hypothetical protein
MGKHCKTVPKHLGSKNFLPHRGERSPQRHTPKRDVSRFDSGNTPDPWRAHFDRASPFLPPTEKKRRKMVFYQSIWNENRPVPIDHREGGILSRAPKKACISILTLETRAPSKGGREGWPRGRVPFLRERREKVRGGGVEGERG